MKEEEEEEEERKVSRMRIQYTFLVGWIDPLSLRPLVTTLMLRLTQSDSSTPQAPTKVVLCCARFQLSRSLLDRCWNRFQFHHHKFLLSGLGTRKCLIIQTITAAVGYTHTHTFLKTLIMHLLLLLLDGKNEEGHRQWQCW